MVGIPVVPTHPTTGRRGLPLSGYPSGFGNLTNAYCWQIQAQGNELYLGTFSWSVMIPPFLPLLPDILKNLLFNNFNSFSEAVVSSVKYLSRTETGFSQMSIEKLLELLANFINKLGQKTMGFDLWKTCDGVHWIPVSLNGLGNPYNYGARMLFLSSDGNLYLGTANPFQGCEVWLKPGEMLERKLVRINN